MEILSFSLFGYEGELIKIEADLRRGLPITDIVGLPGSAVKEARDRVRAAIRNSGLEFPQGRILINLSPADQKKEGSAFDLPIALAILTAKDVNKEDENNGSPETGAAVMIMGELELSGSVRPVRGVLGAIFAGAAQGIKYFIVPKENEEEASIPENVNVFGASTLTEALDLFLHIQYDDTNSPVKTLPKHTLIHKNLFPKLEFVWSDESETANDIPNMQFENIHGQDQLIRALEIAAAGGHNLIAYGPPGCGKTLSLQRFNTLLPDMDTKTARETTRIYSTAGLLPAERGKDVLLKRPPFRMPHPNASMEGMIGGAGKCTPGEVSLAHGGTLFLDEAAQFKASVLQTLRSPLETGAVTLSRAGRSSTFPARFQLLLAINPCPCGNLGASGKICTCMPAEIEKYWKKLTAPLLDRLDIRIAVKPPKPESLLQPSKYSTSQMRKDIQIAKTIQIERAKNIYKENYMDASLYRNSKILPQDIPIICRMTEEAERNFTSFAELKKLSGRGSHAVLRISRTIADIEKAEKISLSHIEEAIALRQWINYLPDFL